MPVIYAELDFMGLAGFRVGADGSVWTKKSRNGYRWTGIWRRLKAGPNKQGYPQVVLLGKHYCVHNLILLAFVGLCPEGMVCRHLNDIPSDNRVRNLCWGTQAENLADARRNGRKMRSKLTEDEVRAVLKCLSSGELPTPIALRFGVDVSTIRRIRSGRNWKWMRL